MNILKSTFQKLTILWAAHLFDWLDKNRPQEMARRIQIAADREAPEIAMRTAMAYLDRLGLLHCALCPQRFGLHTVSTDDRRTLKLCDRHYLHWQKQKTAVAAGT